MLVIGSRSTEKLRRAKKRVKRISKKWKHSLCYHLAYLICASYLKFSETLQKELGISLLQGNFFKKELREKNLVGELKKLKKADIAVLNYMNRVIFNYSFKQCVLNAIFCIYKGILSQMF